MSFPSRFAGRFGRPLLVAACTLACGAALAAEPLSGTLDKIRQSNLISIGHRETS
ncbi:MAG: amino acid ABC transporter substrate-binding protein, partial [Burkholderia sp.]|nr:amino acid ABC transporter substrate-binding protein [Burkholderia sp.]